MGTCRVSVLCFTCVAACLCFPAAQGCLESATLHLLLLISFTTRSYVCVCRPAGGLRDRHSPPDKLPLPLADPEDRPEALAVQLGLVVHVHDLQHDCLTLQQACQADDHSRGRQCFAEAAYSGPNCCFRGCASHRTCLHRSWLHRPSAYKPWQCWQQLYLCGGAYRQRHAPHLQTARNAEVEPCATGALVRCASTVRRQGKFYLLQARWVTYQGRILVTLPLEELACQHMPEVICLAAQGLSCQNQSQLSRSDA